MCGQAAADGGGRRRECRTKNTNPKQRCGEKYCGAVGKVLQRNTPHALHSLAQAS